MITMADVAKEAGVSVMTVSRVVSGKGYVNDATRKKVLRAMKALNYVPKRMSEDEIREATTTLALIVPDITNPFFTFVARVMEDVARKNGYRVLIANTDENSRKEADYVEMCLSLSVDGVLIAPVGDSSFDNLTALNRANIPFVLVDREVPGVEADIVKGNIVSASYDLVTHLVSLGHRRIAVVTGPQTCNTSRERLSGYKQAIADGGLEYDEDLVVESSMTRSVDLRFLDGLLSLTKPPTALFLANLFQYAHVYTAVKDMGLSLPGDLSIVSFGNSDTLVTSDSLATCAIQPTYNFGSLGAQLLLERIEGNPDRPRRIVLESSLVIRESTAAPKVPVEK